MSNKVTIDPQKLNGDFRIKIDWSSRNYTRKILMAEFNCRHATKTAYTYREDYNIYIDECYDLHFDDEDQAVQFKLMYPEILF